MPDICEYVENVVRVCRRSVSTVCYCTVATIGLLGLTLGRGQMSARALSLQAHAHNCRCAMQNAWYLFSCLNLPLFFAALDVYPFLLTCQVGVVDLRRGGLVLHLPYAFLLLQVAQGQGS